MYLCAHTVGKSYPSPSNIRQKYPPSNPLAQEVSINGPNYFLPVYQFSGNFALNTPTRENRAALGMFMGVFA